MLWFGRLLRRHHIICEGTWALSATLNPPPPILSCYVRTCSTCTPQLPLCCPLRMMFYVNSSSILFLPKCRLLPHLLSPRPTFVFMFSQKCWSKCEDYYDSDLVAVDWWENGYMGSNVKACFCQVILFVRTRVRHV